MIHKLTRTIVRTFAFALTLCATTSAWANPWLLSYKSFDNLTSSEGVSLTREAGSVDFIKVDGGFINYSTTANAKFGDHAYQANGGVVGLQNNTSGLVSCADGWTISFWFHPNTQGNWQSFFGFGFLNGDNYFFVKTDATPPTFHIYKDTTSTDASVLGTPVLSSISYTASAWNHVAIVCQPGGSAATIYINGTSAGSFTISSSVDSLREVLLCCGRWHSGADSAFYRNKQLTWFDDFALFRGALSASAISAIAAGESTVIGLESSLGLGKSINANFYYLYGGSNPYTAVALQNNATTAYDNPSIEGYAGYAVTGKYWSDVLASSTAAQSVKVFNSISTSDSTVTATISGANGGAFTGSGFDHHLMSGCLNDSASALSPTVTFSNIPFDNYRVVVYFAVYGGSASKKYGYVTLNDTINLAGDGTTTVYGDGGATGWGGAAVSASGQNNIVYGANTLVSPVLVNNTAKTLTVKGHALYSGSTATYNAGIAAIQIFEVAPETGTYTFTPTADATTAITSSSNWNSVPSGNGEDITISISGDATINVDADKSFGTVTIENTGADAATLTFTGSCMVNAAAVSVPANVTVKVDDAVSGGAPILNAPVSLGDATATLEIAAPATMANIISGSGAVKVSANVVTFTVANTFTGGLTIADGGHAKATIQRGFGPASANITVENGGAIDLATVVVDSSYVLTISGEGIDGSGAAYSSSDVSSNFIQLKSLALSGNATIKGEWGLIQSGYTTATALSLSGYKLTKAGTGSFFMADTGVTASNGGSIEVTGGAIAAIGKQQTAYKSTNPNAPITLKSGASLTVSGFLLSTNITCEPGANISVSSGAYLATYDRTTTTISGQADISGNVLIGWSSPAGATYLDVAGTVNVNGSGLLQIFSTSIIRKVANSDGVVNIGSNATVEWQNSHWKDTDAGDLFRGTGNLFYNCKGGNYGAYATSSFSGILKIGSRNGTNWAALLGTPPQFAERPELTLACGNSASDMGVLYLGDTYANKSLTVRDLNGFGKINGEWNSSSSTGVRTIDTLQTKNTVFDGTFIKSTTRPASTALLVRGSDTVNSLTLTGASDTPGSLTIQDNAKVVFASTGSWTNGTVTVADGGYLESKNASAVAATLDVQSGGTIVIPTVTTTANEETTTSAVALKAGTITFPDSGEATIDVSAIPDLEADATVTILTATTSLDPDISKIRLVGKPYALQVNGNNLNVVNDGGLVWDSTNGWGTKDATKYDAATITSPGTIALRGTSLVFDTVELTGSGTVSFSATDSETVSIKNLTIGDGVTLDVSSALDLTGCTIVGAGTINVPAGVTYTMSNVACSVKVTVQNTGTLKTSGSTNLSSANNNFMAGSQFTVEEGGSTSLNGAEKGLSGTITVASGATLVNSRASDSINFGGATVLNVYGTINMGATRWSLSDGNTINIYEGAVITGNGQAISGTSNAGAWDWIADKTCSVNVYGDATISARLRVRSGATVAVAIASGKTLTFSGSYQNYDSGNGSISVSGGVIKLGALNPFVNGDYSCSLTINDGAAIDINGNKPTNQIYLVGDGPDGTGALINTGADMGSNIAMKITLTGDASWGGQYYTHFGASTDIYLDGHTFTKKGSNNFPLNNTVMRGTGKIVVEEGEFQNNSQNNRLDGIDLEVKTGATLNMAGGTSLRIHDFTCAGTILGDAAKLVVNGTYNVNGAQSIPKLEMVTNSAIAFATTSSKLTVTTLTFALPENGKVLLDVAGLNIPSEGMELINCNSTDNFSAPAGYYLDVVDGSVYAYQTVVNITVPVVANTTVTVTVGGVDQVGVDGDGVKTYSVPYGSAVVVTYAAVSGYKISGTDTYNIASATTDATITVDQDLSSDLIVATFNDTSYTTLQAAVNAWAAADAVTAYMNPVVLTADVTENITIPVNANVATVPLQMRGSATINGTVTISTGATFQPLATVLFGGDVVVNGTLVRAGASTLSIGGDLTIADGATLGATTLDAVNPVYAVTGGVEVEGVLNISLTSSTLEAGTYKVVTGASVTRDEAADVVVFLNTVENNNWVLNSTSTELNITGAAAMVDDEKFTSFTDAVTAAAGSKTIELLASASYTLSVGETLIVDAGSFTMTVTAPEGYAVAQSGSGVVTYTTQKYVARLQNPQDGTSTYQPAVDYTSLADAVAAVTERSAGYYGGGDAIVTLLDDVSLGATVTVAKRMNLNLNGKTLTASGFAAINNSTRLAVQGSGSIAVTSGNSVVLTATTATLTVSGGATLSPEPTVSDTTNYRAKKVTEAGTATYTVVDKVGTIFSVY